MRVFSLLGAMALSPSLLTLVNSAPLESLESTSQPKPTLPSLSHKHTSHGTTHSYPSGTGSHFAEPSIATLLECFGSDCIDIPISEVIDAFTRTFTPGSGPMSHATPATFQGLPTYISGSKAVRAEEMEPVTTKMLGMPSAAVSDPGIYTHPGKPGSWHITHEQRVVARAGPVWPIPDVVLCRAGKTKHCSSKMAQVQRDIVATVTRTASVTEVVHCQSSPSHTCTTLKPDTRMNATMPHPPAYKPSEFPNSINWLSLATADNAAKSSFWKSFGSWMPKETMTRPSHSFPPKPTANGSNNNPFVYVQDKDVLTFSLDPMTITKVSVVPTVTSEPPTFGTKFKRSEVHLKREEEVPNPKLHKSEHTTSHTKHSQSVAEPEKSQSWLTHSPGEPMYTIVKPDVEARDLPRSNPVTPFRPDESLSAKQPGLSKTGSMTKWAQSQPSLANTKPMAWSGHSHLTSSKTGAWTELTGSAYYPHPTSFDAKTKTLAVRDVDTASCNPSWWSVLPVGVSFTPCAQTTTTTSVGNSGIVPPWITESLSAWKHSVSNAGSGFVPAFVTSNLTSFTGTATQHSHKHTSIIHSASPKVSPSSNPTMTHGYPSSSTMSGNEPLETIKDKEVDNCPYDQCLLATNKCPISVISKIGQTIRFCGGAYFNCCPFHHPRLAYLNFKLRCYKLDENGLILEDDGVIPAGAQECIHDPFHWRGPVKDYFSGCLQNINKFGCPPF